MTGWECPKCGRCYAPHVSACDWCGNPPVVMSSYCSCGTTATCPLHGTAWVNHANTRWPQVASETGAATIVTPSPRTL